MKYEIQQQGTYPVIEITLAKGEKFVSEAGAMAWMEPTMNVETAARGGVMASLKRGILGGESFFQNTYSTEAAESKVAFVAGQPGAVAALKMDGLTLCLEKGAYICSDPTVTVETKFEGLKGLFNEGLFVLRASGTGTMFFGGYGDLVEVQVNGEYVVDNGYAVAWDSTLEYNITRSGTKIRSFLFGNQLMLRFKGQGRVWCQSRSPVAFADWVHPFRPVKPKNN